MSAEERDGTSSGGRWAGHGIEVSILGPLRARRDGADVGLGGRRQRAVLARLALARGATVSIDRIIDDLWDGDPPRTATNTIQSYVSNLRRALRRDDEALIARVGDGYRLDVADGALVADRFEALVADARGDDPAGDLRRLEEALALWHGPALGDLADEPWARGDAVRLEELRLAAVEARFDVLLAAGRHAVVVGDLDAAVLSHPLRERLTAQLVVALYRSGRQADALRALERTRAHLADELGLDPGPELARLGAQVLEHDPALDLVDPVALDGPGPATARAPSPTARDGSGSAWTGAEVLGLPAAAVLRTPMVGRAQELAVLQDLWEEVAGGARRFVLVAGEAGMGKTTLAQDLAARVHDEGGHVFWGRSTPDTLIAYQPLVEAVRSVTRSLGADAVDQVLARWPALAPLLPEMAAERGDTTRYEMYEAVAGLVDAVTAERPGLLVLDDAQWADRSTLGLVQHLLGHPRAGRLLVVATVRRPAGRPTPDLDHLAADVARAGIGQVVELDGLGSPEVADLLRGRGVTVAPDVADAVRHRTAGNPFFVSSLADQGGDLGAADVAVLPDTVRDVLDQRLSALDPGAHATLAAAAVIGPRVPLDLLGEVTEQGPEAVLDVVDVAVGSRLLVEEEEIGWVGFPHALVRQALLARTTRNREARLHLRIADALRARGAPAAEEAEHLLAAGRLGDVTRTADAAGRAALDALDALADDEAAAWAERGLAPLAPTAHRARAELGLLLARAERRRGRRDVALRALGTMADDARAAGEPRLPAEAGQEGVLLAGAVGFSFGELDEDLIALLDEALAVVPDDERGIRAGLLAWAALVRGGADDLSEVDALSAEALALAEQGEDPHALALSLLARRVAVQGPHGLAERLVIGPRTTAAAAGWPDLAVVSLVFEVADLMEAGRVDEARQVRERLREVVAPFRRPVFDSYVRFVDACWALVEGDVERGARLSDEAVAVGGEALGTNGLQAWAGQQYIAARERGDLTPLVGQVEEMVRQLPGLAVWRVALAVCRAAGGDDDGARAAYAPLRDGGGLDVGPASALWYSTVCQLAEVAHLLGDAPTCERLVPLLAPVAGNVTITGMGAVSLGPCSRYLGLARAGSGDLDGAAGDLAAAAEACGVAGFAPWRARALDDLASVLERRGAPGDGDDAVARRAEARDLADDLGITLGLRSRSAADPAAST